MIDRYSVLRRPDYGKGGSFAYTGTAGSSGVMSPGATAVWFWCTTDAFVRTGSKASNPTATIADLPVPASTPMLLPLNQSNDGDEHKISAIQITAGGTCYYCAVT